MSSSTFNIETDHITSSLRTDPEPDARTNEPRATVFERLSQIASISQLLRFFGAVAVIVSMSLFMLKGWSEGNDISRYLKLLGQTGLLTGAGAVLSFLVKEYKGARVFFGLSLMSVVANFTILGALTYSMTQWDNQLMNYPSMMKWVVIDPSIFLAVFAGAATLLAVLSRFSFSIFARHIAGPLTISFLLMCSLLLIPVRSSLAVCALAALSLFAARAIVLRLSARDKVVLTPEARAAMALLFVPAFILVARSLTLYPIDTMMLTCFSVVCYVGLRTLIMQFSKTSAGTRLVEVTQLFVSLFLTAQIVDLTVGMSDVYQSILFISLAGGLLVDQLHQSKDESWKSWMLNLSGFSAVFIFTCVAIFFNPIEWTMVSLFVSMMTLSITVYSARMVKYRDFASVSAKLGLLISTVLLGSRFIELVDLSNWMLIGVVGIALILGASVYERFGLSLTSRVAESD